MNLLARKIIRPSMGLFLLGTVLALAGVGPALGQAAVGAAVAAGPEGTAATKAETAAETAADKEADAAFAAAFAAAQEPKEDDTEFSYLALMSRLGLGLGLVVLLAWGAAAVMRRSGLGEQLGAVGGAVRIVDRTFLAPKKAVYLVEIGGRTLALGVTEAQITPLSEWQEGELEIASPPSPAKGGASFKQLIEQMTKRGERS